MSGPLGYVVALADDGEGVWLACGGDVFETPEAAASAGRWYRNLGGTVVALIPVDPT